MRGGLTLFLVAVVLAACTPSPPPGPSPEPLAPDQTLSFAITQDLADLDPALITSPADVDIMRNVFSGLYRFDDRLREVPDIATAMPQVSADGLTYTFRIRSDARFSNGDPVTADDFLYSWSRAAGVQGDYASVFSEIDGYAEVAAGKSDTLRGLAKIDDTTFTARLVRPTTYFVTEAGMWPFWLVDRNVIATAGRSLWTARPDTLVGTGPFRMTARTPGSSIDFAPVTGWYGGKTTGRLTHVHVEVVPDADTGAAQFEAGAISLYGYARQSLSAAAAKRYMSDTDLKSEVSLVPLGVTTWVGFSLRGGAFAGADAGRAGRHAFSTAIDRGALVDAVCNSKTLCDAATGGLIAKGLAGYLGDGADPGAKFDAAAAKAEYAAWDPAGAKVKGLAYTFDSTAFNKALCTNLQLQWKKNLGVDVGCVEMDRKTFFDQRAQCAYPIFRQSWAADFNDPGAWYDALFGPGAASGSCFADPSLPGLLGTGDYSGVATLLAGQSLFAALLYGVQPYLVHSYVKGAGGNALYDYSWTEIRIFQH